MQDSPVELVEDAKDAKDVLKVLGMIEVVLETVSKQD